MKDINRIPDSSLSDSINNNNGDYENDMKEVEDLILKGKSLLTSMATEDKPSLFQVKDSV